MSIVFQPEGSHENIFLVIENGVIADYGASSGTIGKAWPHRYVPLAGAVIRENDYFMTNGAYVQRLECSLDTGNIYIIACRNDPPESEKTCLDHGWEIGFPYVGKTNK